MGMQEISTYLTRITTLADQDPYEEKTNTTIKIVQGVLGVLSGNENGFLDPELISDLKRLSQEERQLLMGDFSGIRPAKEVESRIPSTAIPERPGTESVASHAASLMPPSAKSSTESPLLCISDPTSFAAEYGRAENAIRNEALDTAFDYYTIKGDGDCFFRSVGAALLLHPQYTEATTQSFLRIIDAIKGKIEDLPETLRGDFEAIQREMDITRTTQILNSSVEEKKVALNNERIDYFITTILRSITFLRMQEQGSLDPSEIDSTDYRSILQSHEEYAEGKIISTIASLLGLGIHTVSTRSGLRDRRPEEKISIEYVGDPNGVQIYLYLDQGANHYNLLIPKEHRPPSIEALDYVNKLEEFVMSADFSTESSTLGENLPRILSLRKKANAAIEACPDISLKDRLDERLALIEAQMQRVLGGEILQSEGGEEENILWDHPATEEGM